MRENDLSYKIIGVALKIHSALGPGLLESVYEDAFAHDLRKAGLNIKQQHLISFEYDGIVLNHAFRIDLLVEDKVVIELKAVEHLAPVHFAQTLTYLRLSSKKLALLINFNESSLKNGIHRVVNNL